MHKHETISTKKFAFLIVTLWTRNNSVFGHFSRSDIGLQLDRKLSFNEHTNNKIKIATKGIGFLLKLQPILPHKSLVNIYQSFIRPHLDYGDDVYDQPSNELFSKKIESV